DVVLGQVGLQGGMIQHLGDIMRGQGHGNSSFTIRIRPEPERFAPMVLSFALFPEKPSCRQGFPAAAKVDRSTKPWYAVKVNQMNHAGRSGCMMCEKEAQG
ncbi:MAG: hypothetical protein ACI4O7_07915, partial [Aristaeellaceae bacterium]